MRDFPFVINAVVIGVIFTWFYNPKYGALTYGLSFFGLDPIPFLADENLDITNDVLNLLNKKIKSIKLN